MQAQTDLTNISALKKIRCLKDLFITNAILPYSSLESRVTKKKKKKIYKGFTHDVKRVKSCFASALQTVGCFPSVENCCLVH